MLEKEKLKNKSYMHTKYAGVGKGKSTPHSDDPEMTVVFNCKLAFQQ